MELAQSCCGYVLQGLAATRPVCRLVRDQGQTTGASQQSTFATDGLGLLGSWRGTVESRRCLRGARPAPSFRRRYLLDLSAAPAAHPFPMNEEAEMNGCGHPGHTGIGPLILHGRYDAGDLIHAFLDALGVKGDALSIVVPKGI